MSLVFNETYVRNTNLSVAMIVANPVINDSRVLKTASSLSKQGYKVQIYGLNTEPKIEVIEGYPFKITLISNPRFEMKKKKIWWINEKSYDIETFMNKMIDGFVDIVRQGTSHILHTHDMYGLPIGAQLKSRDVAGSIGWIHDLHEYVEGCTNLPEYQRLFMWEQEKKYLKLPDVLTTVSPILAELISKNYSLDPPAVILNTPRVSDFEQFNLRSIRTALNIDPAAPLMVYNGGVKPPRGVQFAVKALAHMPEVHLALLTNSAGEFMEELKMIAQKDGSINRLHIHPFVPNNEVSSFVRDANLGINPVTIYENSDLALPNKVFEYIHAGLPIVSSATTMMKHFIKEHKCGSVFEAGNIKKLVASVRQTLKKFPHGMPNVCHGSQLAKRYCWEEQEKILAAQYEKMVSKNFVKIKSSVNRIKSVLHLPVHAANQPRSLVSGLTRQNITAKSAALGRNNFKYSDDIKIVSQPFSLDSLKNYFETQGLGGYDAYHYHARPLIFSKLFKKPTGADLSFLKSIGKKVFFIIVALK